MKVRLLASLAGPERFHDAQAGEEWECDAEEAKRLVERGMAEPLAPQKEAAIAGPPENAMAPKARPKRQRSDSAPPGDSEPLETDNRHGNHGNPAQ